MSFPPLPIRNLTFEQIRRDNMLYVDKTNYIYELLREDQGEFFLSRPRRFGKTLLLRTMRSLFKGDRDLFKGLHIDRTDYDFPKVPVIHMSLSLDRGDQHDLTGLLVSKLDTIAIEKGLNVKPQKPGVYFGEVIKALSRSSKSRIAVLIDEYDSPVTKRMDNLEVAKANADVLQDFFTILKDTDVAECVRFSFITGITRFALTAMDSGANHLEDISLNPKFDGICGITTAEFDSFFTDRMETLLESLKTKGQIEPSAGVKQLKEQILDWYDGYNWLGDNRILNPFSLMRAFQQGQLSDYWISSGRPGHLTTLIRKNPDDFCQPKLDSCLGDELRKTQLDGLKAVPVLFHCGYLTLDKMSFKPVKDNKTGKTTMKDVYSLTYPNSEVSSYINLDYLTVIFDQANKNDIESDSIKLSQALLDRDAETVSALFSRYFGAISYHQRPTQEKDFHSNVQILLMGMNFNVGTEMPSSEGRLDLCVELPNKVYVIIELKYCPSAKKLGDDERNQVLSRLARNTLAMDEQYQALANLAMDSLDEKVIFEISEEHPAGVQRNKMLARAATSLPKAAINKTLAEAAMRKLPLPEIEAALNVAAPGAYLSKEQIEIKLSEAAQQVLNAISEKNYHGVVAYKAKEIIDLGLSYFGHGPKVMALFAPKPPSR